jgi:citrate lyase beta subunit
VTIVALLETAAGVENAGSIATAYRILRLAFGSADPDMN